MSPFENSTNLTARLGRWSARHRKTAIFGWLAFVVAAVAVGATLGTQRLDPDTVGAGESQRAQEIVEAGAFADSADESVFVASESHTAADREFRAVLADVVRAVSSQEGVSDVRSPLEAGGAALVAKDRHAALVQFELSDADEQATTLVEPVLQAVAGVQERHPAFRVEQFGAASGQRVFDETVGEDFTRAEYTALPVTLGVLLVVFGALVAAGAGVVVDVVHARIVEIPRAAIDASETLRQIGEVVRAEPTSLRIEEREERLVHASGIRVAVRGRLAHCRRGRAGRRSAGTARR